MDLEHIVIDNIRRIRKEKGISQEKLAEFSETSASYIGLMETYKNIPKLSTIQRIADALNVPSYILFVPENENQPLNDETLITTKQRIKEQIMTAMNKEIDESLKLL